MVPIRDMGARGRFCWRFLTHQQSLLARFPSLGLGFGALAPDKRRITWEDKTFCQRDLKLAVRVPGSEQHRCHLQSDRQAPSSPLPSAASPEEACSSLGRGGGDAKKILGRRAKGRRHPGRQRGRSRPGRLGQAAWECHPQIQVRITPRACAGIPPLPPWRLTPQTPPLSKAQEIHLISTTCQHFQQEELMSTSPSSVDDARPPFTGPAWAKHCAGTPHQSSPILIPRDAQQIAAVRTASQVCWTPEPIPTPHCLVLPRLPCFTSRRPGPSEGQ